MNEPIVYIGRTVSDRLREKIEQAIAEEYGISLPAAAPEPVAVWVTDEEISEIIFAHQPTGTCESLTTHINELLTSKYGPLTVIRELLEDVLEVLCDEPDPIDGGSQHVLDLQHRIRYTLGKMKQPTKPGEGE